MNDFGGYTGISLSVCLCVCPCAHQCIFVYVYVQTTCVGQSAGRGIKSHLVMALVKAVCRKEKRESMFDI